MAAVHQLQPEVQEAISRAPDSPGVYLFRDSQGRPIYVGKARSLRKRLATYAQPPGAEPREERLASMLSQAASLDWMVTKGEVESLLLEYSLIKKYRPRYNVKYRDDKSYPWLVVTVSEEFPRAGVLRGRKRKGVRYFGPFAHAYAVRETLDLLLKTFPVRTCSNVVYARHQRLGRPCLLYHLGKCAGPCAGKVGREEYAQHVRGLISFLEGRHGKFLVELEEEMRKAAEALEFERAALLRDRLQAVKKAVERQEAVLSSEEDVDAVAFAGDELELAFQIFFVRGGRVVGRRGSVVERLGLDEGSLLAGFLREVYMEREEVPPLLLVPVKPEDAEVLLDWLEERRGGRVEMRVPRIGEKRRLLETVRRNAEEALAQQKLRRAADLASRSRALEALGRELGLAEAPLRIECFDISNLGPVEAVGSMVVFEDGLPRKSEYRRFRIKLASAPDDVACMEEVVRRRFRRYLEEREAPLGRESRFRYPPQLVVVDGGRPQVTAALRALHSLGLDIPVVGLAKRLEDLYLPDRLEPLRLPPGSPALYLLQHLRDEAHRFALTYHRLRRTKRSMESVLDGVVGIGPARKRMLVERFGSLVSLARAAVEEVAALPGISRELAERVLAVARASVEERKAG